MQGDGNQCADAKGHALRDRNSQRNAIGKIVDQVSKKNQPGVRSNIFEGEYFFL